MRRLLLLALTTCACFGAADIDLIQPEQAVKDLHGALVIHVGFPVLYRSTHIPGSVFAGPGSKDEGIADLKKAVASQPHTREIILYCGCCPFDRCPNIRPAFAALRALGFTNVRAVSLPANLKTDWIDKGYPIEKRAADAQ
jgi:rhodanese-related sulfurtransferase